uniref:Uncharacterized protein n=1 Tax=Arundo donax TaxID=35708 RepID=A0A0A9DKR1_ARUDO
MACLIGIAVHWVMCSIFSARGLLNGYFPNYNASFSLVLPMIKFLVNMSEDEIWSYQTEIFFIRWKFGGFYCLHM